MRLRPSVVAQRLGAMWASVAQQKHTDAGFLQERAGREEAAEEDTSALHTLASRVKGKSKKSSAAKGTTAIAADTAAFLDPGAQAVMAAEHEVGQTHPKQGKKKRARDLGVDGPQEGNLMKTKKKKKHRQEA